MRVLHVIEVEHGGVVTYVRALADSQAKRGWDVHVLAPKDAGSFAGSRHEWAISRRNPLSLLRAVGRLGRVVDQIAPDVVHLHSFFPGLIGRAKAVSAPVVYQPHSWAFRAVPKMTVGLIRALEGHAQRHTAAVLVNCESEGQEGARAGLRLRPHVVGVPIDLDHFSPSALANSALPLERGNRSVLVCVGRLSAQKGQLELARAWEKHPLPATCLVFVGPGNSGLLAEAAPSTFGDSLLHVGEQSDVRPFLAAAKLSLLPSRYEGQSVAMAESLACGVPVVMTDVNGAREAIESDPSARCGQVVPVGDMAALLEAAALRIGAPDLIRDEGLNARMQAVRLFDIDVVAAQVAQVYVSAAEVTDGVRSRGVRS